jgi:hypothetical protein
MEYLYLLAAGSLVSVVHFYLVWHHRDNRRYSISEHAILSRRSHQLYFVSHLACEVLFLAFSYQFFVREHHLLVPHYLNIVFAVLDFVQAVVPSQGRTEAAHIAAAYISWVSYLSAGIVAFIQLDVTEPYRALAIALLLPILGMFAYMHINHSKLYPYQLLIVPLFVLYMLCVAVGAR